MSEDEEEDPIFAPGSGLTLESGVKIATLVYGKDVKTEVAWDAIIARSMGHQNQFRYFFEVFKRLTNTPDDFATNAEWQAQVGWDQVRPWRN